MLTAFRHGLQLAWPHLDPAAISVVSFQHEHALAAAVPMLRKTRAGREAQQPCARALWRRTQSELERLQPWQE